MHKETITMNNGGIGFVGALTVLFAAGKIFGYLDWSWWWVFSPIWITWSVVAGFGLIFGAVVLILAWLDENKKPKRFRF